MIFFLILGFDISLLGAVLVDLLLWMLWSNMVSVVLSLSLFDWRYSINWWLDDVLINLSIDLLSVVVEYLNVVIVDYLTSLLRENFYIIILSVDVGIQRLDMFILLLDNLF